MRVLIIGSLGGELGTAAGIAGRRGARLEHTDDIGGALQRLRSDGRVNLVLCELGQPIAELVRALTHERIAVPVIACGPEDDPDAAARAVRDGAQDFLPLPPDPELIAAFLESASGETHALMARDPLMLDTVQRAEQVARSEASVLITGESGTGKEVLARHIHRRSRRADAPFIALNCAAIPEHLLESELFGHEKGAFSGAVARRIGKFEAAHGGTLLLDEISEMDVRLQAKLLRAIQEREIDRLGGSAPVKIDVRILATSNRDLAAEAAAGRFREDLYFRLNVVGLPIPPLRARPGDISLLSAHFVRHYAQVNGLPPRPLSEAAMRLLLRHQWRGNVRELENAMHRAVLMASGPQIDVDAVMLPGMGPAPANRPASELAAPIGAVFPSCGVIEDPPYHQVEEANPISGLVGRRMDEVEQALILGTLHSTSGNRTHAATILGISIRALRNKLRDYASQGVSVPPPAAGVAA
ncbi:sigma 54-interacting transcriptional regulator [Rhizosaccharibacter radicis]|uniref:Sigma-54 dependent transcriptional regulator n=1 Tax=Rhizosaccharibacter radicis TaxID=2782605 RepID=A0ABT1VSC5_9PROT|nr:sigma-54 dependent transcriptional regulator [Acetobacteraceae bacterium KSS12]